MGKDQRSKVERARQHLSRACTYMYRMSGQAHMYVHVGMESEAKANARRPMQKVVGIDCAVNDICAVEQRAQKGGGNYCHYYYYYYRCCCYYCTSPLSILPRYYLLLRPPGSVGPPQARRFTSAFRKCCDKQTAKHCRWSLTLPVTWLG